jgi:tetratricopeptide (TPR) repeat protein
MIAYATALIINNKDAEARKLFAATPKVFQDPKVLNSYIFSKQFDKAITEYKTMIKENPTNKGYYESLAYTYILAGQNTLAISILQDAIVKFPDSKTQYEGAIKQIQEGKIKPQ